MKKENIEKILSELQLEYEIKGSVFTIQTNEDRTEILKSITKKIKNAKFLEKSSKSSKGEVKIDSFSIIAKKPKGGGAGSGAGAYITALAESAQCYYCAAAWYGKNFSDKTLRETSKYADTPGMSVEQVIKDLPEHWVTSCVKSAVALKRKYGSKKIYFHRGSNKVNQIVDNFNYINKIFRTFSNINKWSPADIYMFTEKGLRESFDFQDFHGLNSFLLEKAKDKEIIGVSLKQTQVASVKEINFNKTRNSYQFVDATIGKKGFFESKDVFVYFEDGQIQFRGFPTWQGEIKGKYANHGKISGGPIKTIVDKHSKIKLDVQSIIETQIKKKDPKFYKKFYEYYAKLTKPVSFNDFMKTVSDNDLNWQSSKYLGTQLIYIFETQPNKRQIILSSMINYAKSQSDDSGPHIKVE